MRADVANVFLKILEEPPESATLILTATSPFSLLPTILSRCMQFHFAPLPVAEVEKILSMHSDRKPADIKLAAQLSEGSPGLALELDLEDAVEKRRAALRVLDRAARGQDLDSCLRTRRPSRRIANRPLKTCLACFMACCPTYWS